MKRSALRPSLPPVPRASNVPRKRRVSFHNRTSVHLFRRRDQSKSLPSSPPQPHQVEEPLNDESPSPQVASPLPPLQPAQFVGFSSSDSGEFPLEPFHDGRDFGLSSSSMSLTGPAWSGENRTQRRSSAFSTEMDTEKIFLFPSSPLSSPLPFPESPGSPSCASPEAKGGNEAVLASPDLSSSLMSFSTDPSNSEMNQSLHQLEARMASMSLQGLVEADQLDINQDSSLESDHCSPLDDGDSFTCFEIIEDSHSSSPSSPSLSWRVPISEDTLHPSESREDSQSSLALSDPTSPGTSVDASEGGTCSLTAFLDVAQVDFRLSDRSSRKVSLGFPSDSLTTLLARCSDTDPSLSAAQLRCKGFLIDHSLSVRRQFTAEHDIRPLQQRVDECMASIDDSAPDYLCVPVAMEYTNRCRLQALHRACVVKAKMEWNEEIRTWQHAHSQWLATVERSLHKYARELEQQMVSAVPIISPPRPVKISRDSMSRSTGRELNKIKEKLHAMAEELDILHGVVPWALTKSEHGHHSRALILRFQQHYELSLMVDTTSGCNRNSTVSSIFYRRPQSPANVKPLHSTEGILDSQREHIIQYLMSKSPLVQHRNSTSHLCSLVEAFSVRLARTFEFLSRVERHLTRQQLVCTGVEYRTCNTDARALAKGKFLVRLRCYKMSDRQRVPATLGVEWKCDLQSAAYAVRQLSRA